VGVVLQDGGRPHGAHGTFDELVDRVSLGLTARNQHDVARLHDRGEPLGQAVLRHLLDVAAEEARVVGPGLLGERLDPGA